MTAPVRCTCGTLLSPDGLSWIRQGYRLSRRNLDGTPVRGTVSRPSLRGARCRQCIDAAVKAARTP